MDPALEAVGRGLAHQLRAHFKKEGLEFCVCILGGTTFNCPDSEDLVKRIAEGLSEKLRERVVFVTGGMAGVQETFAKSCRKGCHLRNLLPEGGKSGFGVGTDIHAGKDMNERKAVFGELGDVYITVEGGPGVAQEAKAAAQRGAAVVPLIRTGGASSGMFEFPSSAMQKPLSMPEAQWAALADEDAEIDVSVAAAIEIVMQYAAAALTDDSASCPCACACEIARSFMRGVIDCVSIAMEMSKGRENIRDTE